MTPSQSPTDFVSAFDAIIANALAEDLHAGDVTASATVPAHQVARARIETREPVCVCGLEIARRVFAAVDPAISFSPLATDGDRVEAGATLVKLAGNARALLAAERTALNLLQRATAVATKTAAFVEKTSGGTRITDTRKTMPGLRALDRYAVRCGGGHNHRNDLGAGVLIKENHIRSAGSLEAAIAGARATAPHTLRICCEVESLEEAARAAAAGADALLLDNMDDAQVRDAVASLKDSLFLEASGGITLARVETLSALGVDAISVGALTHSAQAVDLSMLFEFEPNEVPDDPAAQTRP